MNEYFVVLSVPFANRFIFYGAISTVVDSPCVMSSAITVPTAGASLNPCPLKPEQTNRPSIPSTESIIGCRSGVVVYKPEYPVNYSASARDGIRLV